MLLLSDLHISEIQRIAMKNGVTDAFNAKLLRDNLINTMAVVRARQLARWALMVTSGGDARMIACRCNARNFFISLLMVEKTFSMGFIIGE